MGAEEWELITESFEREWVKGFFPCGEGAMVAFRSKFALHRVANRSPYHIKLLFSGFLCKKTVD